MTMYRVEAALPSHAEQMIELMRQKSVEEVAIVSHRPLEDLATSIEEAAYAWVAWADNKLACMWGATVVSVLGNAAYIWMLTTPVVEQHRFAFVRQSRVRAAILLQEFNELIAVTPDDGNKSHRWLRLIGFESSQVMDVDGAALRIFRLKRDS